MPFPASRTSTPHIERLPLHRPAAGGAPHPAAAAPRAQAGTPSGQSARASGRRAQQAPYTRATPCGCSLTAESSVGGSSGAPGGTLQHRTAPTVSQRHGAAAGRGRRRRTGGNTGPGTDYRHSARVYRRGYPSENTSIYFLISFKSFASSHYIFVSTTCGGLLRKPMNQPVNGVAEIR